MGVPTKYRKASDPSKCCGTCANFGKVNSACNKFVTYVDKGAVCDAYASTALKVAQAAQVAPAPVTPPQQTPEQVPQSTEIARQETSNVQEQARLDSQNVKLQAPKVPEVKPVQAPKLSPPPSPTVHSKVAAIRDQLAKLAEAQDDETDYTPVEPVAHDASYTPADTHDRDQELQASKSVQADLEHKLDLATKNANKIASDARAEAQRKVETAIKAAEAAQAEIAAAEQAVKEAEAAKDELIAQAADASKIAQAAQAELKAVKAAAEARTTRLTHDVEAARHDLANFKAEMAIKLAEAGKHEPPPVQDHSRVFDTISSKLSTLTDAIKTAGATRTVVQEPQVFEKISSQLSDLATAIKQASAQKQAIHVEPAKVIMDNKPKSWVFTVGAHVPGEEYQVKAEAVETLK